MRFRQAMLGTIAAAMMVATLGAQDRVVDKAFAQYDRIAQALVRDSVEGIPEAAAALQPMAVDLAGEAATDPAARVAAARTIEDIRAAFAAVSEILVPKFLDAELPGVSGFVCTMKKAQWVQKGTTVANPYYGKAMPTCGVPIKR